jgi:hypothetical protein
MPPVAGARAQRQNSARQHASTARSNDIERRVTACTTCATDAHWQWRCTAACDGGLDFIFLVLAANMRM